jgi:hypothetical protein
MKKNFQVKRRPAHEKPWPRHWIAREIYLSACGGGATFKEIEKASKEGETPDTLAPNYHTTLNALKRLVASGEVEYDESAGLYWLAGAERKPSRPPPGPRALGKIEDQDEDKEEAGGEESFNPFEKRFTGSQIFAALDQARVPAEYLAAFGKALMNPAPPNTEPAPTPPPDTDEIPE